MTGDVSGRLVIWRLRGDSVQLPSVPLTRGALPRHYADVDEFTDLATGVNVKRVNEICCIQRSTRCALVSGHFDTNGQMGVIGTDDSNLW